MESRKQTIKVEIFQAFQDLMLPYFIIELLLLK